MRNIGIVAEYNPFHNGHLFQLEKIKEKAKCDSILVAMSGDFVQRGFPACVDKITRAKMALSAGVDLVLEIPVLYATSSAEDFALGGVSLLNSTGIVDTLAFGAENDDRALFLNCAETLLKRENDLSEGIREGIRNGYTYPLAREYAYNRVLKGIIPSDFLNKPNNILGLEYTKTILKYNMRMDILPIKRNGDYSSNVLSTTDASFSSAGAIRESIKKDGLSSVKTHLPDFVYESLLSQENTIFPIEIDSFSEAMHYALLMNASKGYEEFLDVDRSLSDRILKCLPDYLTYSSFIEEVKTKNITYSHVARALLHILLGIKKADAALQKEGNPIRYRRVLGFRQESRALFSEMTKETPILCTNSDIKKLQNPLALSSLSLDLNATRIFAMAVNQVYGQPLPSDFSEEVLKV